jgi:AsmA-like C-terminal region
LIVGPNQTAVTGPIGGKLVVNSQPGTEIPTVVGKLTLDNGTVQPGFLRSPIVVTHSATLVLDGKGLILDLPASRLEGEPLDFRMAVADLNRPQLRIDANAARLNFEVMRFIRLPWSRSTPPQFFPVPVTGHIEAQNGIFDKLAMSKISTDFYHNSQTWAVENFRAGAFNGSMDLRISGRARDDWINMTGTIRGMDAGPLFLLSENSGQPPILGKLAATGDLWANTSTDFFRTLGGTVSITITDGNLNRFTLLKRILSLVNLKNWLTAQFPDPREAGIPFKTLDADFRAVRGNFYTDNLRLNGPVMDITARGNIDFATNTMDMEIDLLALQTVNWLINNIPIIGKNLSAATKHLVGAYFQVRGPTANPSIRPKPLTSVEQFVLRTLTLPINIVAPNTVE